MASKKYYVVWQGRQTGVFTTWPECQRQISGFPGAKYKSFKSRAEAESAFRGAHQDYIGQGKGKASKKKQASLFTGNTAHRPIVPSISVDAACSGNPGLMEYRGVDTETEEVIFHEGPFSWGTNNIGEFLALVDALRLQTERGTQLPIYTDSRTAMAWVRRKRVNTTLERVSDNAALFARTDDAEQWLKTHDFSFQIIKWETEIWGEIPADFGRK